MSVARATARYQRISPRKVRLVADLVRGRRAEEALACLERAPQRAARTLSKVIRSAVANAEANHEVSDGSVLFVRQLLIDGGPILHRWRPMSMARAGRIRKRTSHITVVLDENPGKEE